MIIENKSITGNIGADRKETTTISINHINGYSEIHRSLHYKSGYLNRVVIALTKEELQLANEAPNLLEACREAYEFLGKITAEDCEKMGISGELLMQVFRKQKQVMQAAELSELPKPKDSIVVTKLKQIDADNLKLGVVITKNGQVFETTFQYIISSNSAHHSDIEFEEQMESIGVDIGQICDDIESRKLRINY